MKSDMTGSLKESKGFVTFWSLMEFSKGRQF
jgi:hypothetical protein